MENLFYSKLTIALILKWNILNLNHIIFKNLLIFINNFLTLKKNMYNTYKDG